MLYTLADHPDDLLFMAMCEHGMCEHGTPESMVALRQVLRGWYWRFRPPRAVRQKLEEFWLDDILPPPDCNHM